MMGLHKVKTYAWYFPNWHSTELNDLWHGKGWTEWECVKYAAPRFDGHIQPKKPLWGYENESDPKVFEKKIETAKKYGLDGFIFDFYWFKKEGAYRRAALDRGFLGAANNRELEFSVMWCNHDPIYAHPAAYKHDNMQLTSGDVDEELVKEVTDYCIKHYFPLENYQRVDGKVYFGIWDISKFIANFNGADGAAKVLADFRKRAAEAGFEIHLAAHRASLPYYKNDSAKCNEIIKQLGIDSVFSYSWMLPKSEDWPKVDYEEYRKINVDDYSYVTSFLDVPFDITVVTGWDCSARTVPSDRYENIGYPFTQITVNNTPQQVKKAFEAAKEFSESGKFTGNMVTVSCWNEWTEGSYLEPDEEYGYGYLEAFYDVFGKDK